MTQQQRDFLIEIEGESVAFTGAGSQVTASWGILLVEAVITAPPIQTMGVSPYDGSFQNGGLSVGVTEVSAYLQSRLTEPRTTLTADVNRTTTTVSVTDTSLFAASGVIWVGREAIAYGAKTASAFTGCTRGYYGTTAQEHSETVKPVNGSQAVYGYNPTWFGRKVWIRIFDPTEAAPALTTIASGRIDGVSFDGTGFVLSLISVAQDLERETIAAGQRATGRLRFANVRDEKRRGLVGAGSIPKDQTVASVFVVVDRESEPFQRDTTAAAGVLATVTNAAIAVNDEVISYRQTAYPAISATVNNVFTTSRGPSYQLGAGGGLFRVGDSIRFTDSATSEIVTTTVTYINDLGYVYHAATGKAPAVGSSVTSPNLQLFAQLTRAQVSTKQEDHAHGSPVQQVYVQSGSHVDLVLQLLLSDTGDGTNGVYDVLPSGFGAGLTLADVDVDSFNSLRPFSIAHTAVLREPVSPKSALQELAHATGGRIYVSTSGQITARHDYALYPDSTSQRTLTVDDLISLPTWAIETGRIYNQWTWKFERDRVTTTYSVGESVAVHGPRSYPEVSGGRAALYPAASAIGVAQFLAVSTLLRHGQPTPLLTCEIPENELDVLEPGQLIQVTIPHLPTQTGSTGLSLAWFEVIEFAPNGEAVTLRLLRLREQGRVGLFAPAALVESVAGSVITLQPAADTYFSPGRPREEALGDVLGPGRDGQEDVDWFLTNDNVQIIDVSTLGGTPTTASTTISTIDYNAREIEVAALPGWLAAGDLIRLDDYAAVDGGSRQTQRTPYYLWWADEQPILTGGDDPYEWGP